MNTEIYYSLSYLLLCCFVLLFLAFLHHLTFSFFILFCSDTYLWSSTTSLGLKNKSILKVIKINRVVNNIKIAFFFFFGWLFFVLLLFLHAITYTEKKLINYQKGGHNRRLNFKNLHILPGFLPENNQWMKTPIKLYVY